MVNWLKNIVTAATGQGVTPDNHRTVHDQLQGNVNQLRAVADAREAIRTKIPVRFATTGAGTLSSSYAAGQTLDGGTLATGDRILIKDAGAGKDNGIYTVNASGAPTRATDADSAIELSNAMVSVAEGTVNAGAVFTQVQPLPVVGTTALTWLRSASPAIVTQAQYDALPSSLKTQTSGILFVVSG